MSHHFVIAPDFPPNLFGGWYTLNTLLQKRTNLAIHLETPTSSAEEAQMLAQGKADLIYANPFDAAKLIREHGYKAIAKPIGKSDEMVIVSPKNSPIKTLSDLPRGAKVAMADNKDVKLIGLRLLEAVDLSEDDLEFNIVETYQAAAKLVAHHQADVAFFIAEIYHSLSNLTRSHFNILIESNMADITHVVLAKPDFAHADLVQDVLTSLNQDREGRIVLTELGIADGFMAVDEEEAEFMIDLMETLLD